MKKVLAYISPHFEIGARIMLGIFLTLGLLISLIYAVLYVTHKYQLDYGEAPLVSQSRSLGNGENIYRRDLTTPPYTVTNYPPLYVLLLTPFTMIFGPSFFPARLISLASTILSALFLGGIVFNLTQNKWAARMTGGVFLTIPYVVEWSAHARVDMLALAFSTGALYLGTQPVITRKKTLAVTLLLTASIYTRQSYGFAAPLALFVWYFIEDRRRAFLLAGITAAISVVVLLFLNLVTRGGFVFHIIKANVNPFHWTTVMHYWTRLRDTAPLMIFLTLAYICFTSFKNRIWQLTLPYLLASAAAALTIVKIGSNVNYLVELSAALSLITGIILTWRMRSDKTRDEDGKNKVSALEYWLPVIRGILIILIAIQVGLFTRTTLLEPVQGLKWRIKPQEKLAYLDWFVSNKPDPILADEHMGMLVLQDRPLTFQPFEMTQLANAGLWDESDLLKSISQKKASAILIHHFIHYPVYTTRWTPAMLDTISENYIVTTNAADTLIFEPYDDALYGPLNQVSCPGAPWDLPTKSEMGMWWINRQLILMGMGEENDIPVYAVADGELTRKQGWVDVVAIKHENPLEPGQYLWVYYSGMAREDYSRSYIVSELPTGSEGVYVHKGQLLGYQGRFRNGSIWVHLGLAIVESLDDGSSPPYEPLLWFENAALPQDQLPGGEFVDPSVFLGIKRSQVMGEPVWLPLQCQIATQ